MNWMMKISKLKYGMGLSILLYSFGALGAKSEMKNNIVLKMNFKESFVTLHGSGTTWYGALTAGPNTESFIKSLPGSSQRSFYQSGPDRGFLISLDHDESDQNLFKLTIIINLARDHKNGRGLYIQDTPTLLSSHVVLIKKEENGTFSIKDNDNPSEILHFPYEITDTYDAPYFGNPSHNVFTCSILNVGTLISFQRMPTIPSNPVPMPIQYPIEFQDIPSQYQALLEKKQWRQAWDYLNKVESQIQEEHIDLLYNDYSIIRSGWLKMTQLQFLNSSEVDHDFIEEIKNEYHRELQNTIQQLIDFSLWAEDPKQIPSLVLDRFKKETQETNKDRSKEDIELSVEVKKYMWQRNMKTLSYPLQNERFYSLVGTSEELATYYNGLAEFIHRNENDCHLSMPYWKQGLSALSHVQIQDQGSLKDLGWDTAGTLLRLYQCNLESHDLKQAQEMFSQLKAISDDDMYIPPYAWRLKAAYLEFKNMTEFSTSNIPQLDSHYFIYKAGNFCQTRYNGMHCYELPEGSIPYVAPIQRGRNVFEIGIQEKILFLFVFDADSRSIIKKIKLWDGFTLGEPADFKEFWGRIFIFNTKIAMELDPLQMTFVAKYDLNLMDENPFKDSYNTNLYYLVCMLTDPPSNVMLVQAYYDPAKSTLFENLGSTHESVRAHTVQTLQPLLCDKDVQLKFMEMALDPSREIRSLAGWALKQSSIVACARSSMETDPFNSPDTESGLKTLDHSSSTLTTTQRMLNLFDTLLKKENFPLKLEVIEYFIPYAVLLRDQEMDVQRDALDSVIEEAKKILSQLSQDKNISSEDAGTDFRIQTCSNQLLKFRLSH